MKVLFLDHYGVLSLSKQPVTRTELSMISREELNDATLFDDFDKDAVNILNDIIDLTGAEIVVSSDWKRHKTLNEMCDFYQQQGIKKMPLAYTDWLPGAPTYHEQRATEISTWLAQHPETTHWAAVDDLYMGTWLTNFAWAKNVHLGIKDVTVKTQIINLIGG
jgi:hypothetical protein